MSNGLHRHPQRPIVAGDVEAYQRDGVVCLRGMFDAAWCSRLHDAALQVMESGAGRVREPKLAPGEGRFYSNVYLCDLHDDFRALRDLSPAPEIAAALMGSDRVRFYYDQLFIKDPGTPAPTPWHNDLPFWPFRGNDLISLWIALTPVSRETSGVQYVAGSHRWRRMYRARSRRTTTSASWTTRSRSAPIFRLARVVLTSACCAGTCSPGTYCATTP